MSEAPKKRARKPKAAPAMEPVNEPAPYDLGVEIPTPPKPPHDPMRGEKTPAVIRWRRDFLPETMAATYRNWDWQAYLASNPPEFSP